MLTKIKALLLWFECENLRHKGEQIERLNSDTVRCKCKRCGRTLFFHENINIYEKWSPRLVRAHKKFGILEIKAGIWDGPHGGLNGKI